MAAVFGVAIGTLALVVTLGVMEGYRRTVRDALMESQAHAVGFSPSELAPSELEAVVEGLEGLEGVRWVSGVRYLGALLQGLRAADEPPQSVVVKAVVRPPLFLELDAWPENHRVTPIWVGTAMAAALDLDVGSRSHLTLPPEPGRLTLPRLEVEIAGIYHSSFSELDAHWIVVPLHSLAGVGVERAAGVELFLDDPLSVDRRLEELEAAAPQLYFTDWRASNGALFAALRWQTISLFVVLSLVIAIASFQVASTVVIVAIEQRRALQLLRALGASRARARRLLCLVGLILGGGGVVLGAGVGAIVCWVATSTRLIRFPEGLAEVYLIDHVPLVFGPVEALSVVAVGFALVLTSSAWIARLVAARSLRYAD